MYDQAPLRTVCALLLPVALLLVFVWLLVGPETQDAVFTALKLVVTR